MELPFRTEADQGSLPGGGDWGRTWPGKQGTGHKPVRGPVAPQGNSLEGKGGEGYSRGHGPGAGLGAGSITSGTLGCTDHPGCRLPGLKLNLVWGTRRPETSPAPWSILQMPSLPQGPQEGGRQGRAQNHPAHAESQAQTEGPLSVGPPALSRGPTSQLPGRRVLPWASARGTQGSHCCSRSRVG